jgi:hypothetical protein
VAGPDRAERFQPGPQGHVQVPHDEGARLGQHGHAVPGALLETDGAHEPPVQGRVGMLERLGAHVLVLEDAAQQAADLRIGRPPRMASR